MWRLSGFVDEISADFSDQCKVASGLGLNYVEVRSAWGINILDLDNGQLEVLRQTLDEYGLKVSSIGSPIGRSSSTTTSRLTWSGCATRLTSPTRCKRRTSEPFPSSSPRALTQTGLDRHLTSEGIPYA
jgi:hypothetical protein